MVKRIRYKTSFLFPRTNLLIGVGSVLNIAGNHFNFKYSSSGDEADSKALKSDWGMVGEDIIEATKRAKSRQLVSQE